MSVKRCVTFPQIMMLGSIVNSDFSLSHFCFEITKCYWPVHYAVLLQYTVCVWGGLDIKFGHLARHTPCHAMKYWLMGCIVFSWKIPLKSMTYVFFTILVKIHFINIPPQHTTAMGSNVIFQFHQFSIFFDNIFMDWSLGS